ncbi:MAG: histidinol dehydrogenase [Chitinophagaceae bacterium]
MKIFLYPNKNTWKELLVRPTFDNVNLQEQVSKVLKEVQQNGDAAIKKYTAQFDGVELNDFVVTENEITLAIASLSNELKQAIETAANNINTFHQKQVAKIEVVETMSGVNCWRKSIGIEKVGLYISWWNSTFIFNHFNVGNSCKNCWL